MAHLNSTAVQQLLYLSIQKKRCHCTCLVYLPTTNCHIYIFITRSFLAVGGRKTSYLTRILVDNTFHNKIFSGQTIVRRVTASYGL